MRVLMLGWEFPPHISGGLGTACEGIVRGLVAQGVEVLLVLPRLEGDEAAMGVELRSASEVPIEAVSGRIEPDPLEALELRTVASPLRPYQDSATYRRAVQRMARDRTSSDRPAELRGGYGPDLFAEVERYARAVARIAASERFDVVHAHDWMTYPAGLLARRVSGRPLVAHLHASEWDRAGEDGDPNVIAVERAGLLGADRVICVSHLTRRVAEERYGAPGDRLRVVHNAVARGAVARGGSACTRPPALASRMAAPAPIAPLDLATRSGRPALDRTRSALERAPTVLFLGRLTRQKGPAFFLEAAQLVHERLPEARFLVAGDGDLRADLIEAAASSGLMRQIFFTGFLGPQEVERAYAEADVYVMPSVSEPFGIAPLEALDLDVPVIVARDSGVAEVLPSAPKVTYGDVRDLASKILLLLSRPDLREALVRTGRREIAGLRWETCAARVGLVYEEVQRAAPSAVGGRT